MYTLGKGVLEIRICTVIHSRHKVRQRKIFKCQDLEGHFAATEKYTNDFAFLSLLADVSSCVLYEI